MNKRNPNSNRSRVRALFDEHELWSVNELCEMLPDLTRQQIKDVLAEVGANRGRGIYSLKENGPPRQLFKSDKFRKLAARSLEYEIGAAQRRQSTEQRSEQSGNSRQQNRRETTD